MTPLRISAFWRQCVWWRWVSWRVSTSAAAVVAAADLVGDRRKIDWCDQKDFVTRLDHFVTRLEDFVTRLEDFVTRLEDFVTRLEDFVRERYDSVIAFYKGPLENEEFQDNYSWLYVHCWLPITRAPDNLNLLPVWTKFVVTNLMLITRTPDNLNPFLVTVEIRATGEDCIQTVSASTCLWNHLKILKMLRELVRFRTFRSVTVPIAYLIRGRSISPCVEGRGGCGIWGSLFLF